jgi:hypothetical protein
MTELVRRVNFGIVGVGCSCDEIFHRLTARCSICNTATTLKVFKLFEFLLAGCAPWHSHAKGEGRRCNDAPVWFGYDAIFIGASVR